MGQPFIVGLGGATRPGSSGERMVRAVLARREPQDATSRMFAGPCLRLLPQAAQLIHSARHAIPAARELNIV